MHGVLELTKVFHPSYLENGMAIDLERETAGGAVHGKKVKSAVCDVLVVHACYGKKVKES